MKSTNQMSCEQLVQSLPEFFSKIVGSGSTSFNRVASPDSADGHSIVFCSTPKAIALGLESAAAALVVPAKALAEAEPKRGSKTLIVGNNVERAMATTINKWFLASPYTDASVTGIHASAVIHPSSEVGANTRVGPHAVIAANVKIGANCFIGANAVIEANVQIGDGTVIHPLAYIGHSTQIGARCEIFPNATIGKEGYGYAHDEKGNHYRIPHQGRVVLEDDVHIGANCSIDRATFNETRIGAGTKFDNMIHIGHNCKIGRNGLVTAKFTMAGSGTIGNNFVTGGDTNISGHLKICDNVQLAALSGVTKDITEPGQYGGVPLQPLQTFIKTKAALAQLPQMRKHLAMLMKKFMPEELEND